MKLLYLLLFFSLALSCAKKERKFELKVNDIQAWLCENQKIEFHQKQISGFDREVYYRDKHCLRKAQLQIRQVQDNTAQFLEGKYDIYVWPATKPEERKANSPQTQTIFQEGNSKIIVNLERFFPKEEGELLLVFEFVPTEKQTSTQIKVQAKVRNKAP